MLLEEIKKAVEKGKTVHWSNENYTVIRSQNQWLIQWKHNSQINYIGLIWQDGKTMNGNPEEFFLVN